ncbi:hypothetical protein VPNG_09278 [Cytospora leucostoma]|uniref:Uncharacterized protein n=1 Tax=Cytospora leucostoma TaxID=1230097 RepID=A0A423W0S2_9PEZI|nr:hypothetical protein VPNG_09278 [Cytospora leucostoma]
MGRAAGKKELDPYVMEYMLKPAFWVLGIFLAIVWGIFVWAQFPATKAPGDREPSAEDIEAMLSAEPDATPRDEDDSDTTVSHNPVDPHAPLVSPQGPARPQRWDPTLTLWLAPVMTRSNRVIAAAMYLFFLGAALLEAYWLLATSGRATVKMARFWFVLAGRGAPLWAHLVYALAFGGMIATDLAALFFSVALVLPLVLCVLEVVGGATYLIDEAEGVGLDVVTSRGTPTEDSLFVNSQDDL